MAHKTYDIEGVLNSGNNGGVYSFRDTGDNGGAIVFECMAFNSSF